MSIDPESLNPFDRLSLYAHRLAELDEADSRLCRLRGELKKVAESLHRELGPETVLVRNGRAWVPHRDGLGLRAGYDPFLAVILDGLDDLPRKPFVTIRPHAPREDSGTGDDQVIEDETGTGEFEAVSPLDPRD